MDSVSEFTLISLISQLLPLHDLWDPEWETKIITLIIQIISLLRSMDLDSQPKPESKLMSLVTQTVSLFNSMDLDSLPEPLSKLISHISQKISADSDHKPESDFNFGSLTEETLQLKPEPELVSLIRQVVSVVIFMNPKLKKLICLCPQVKGYFDEGKFHLIGESSRMRGRWNLGLGEEVSWTSRAMWNCLLGNWTKIRLTGREEEATHFYCESCKGEYHGEYEKAPLEIKHPLHQRHSLQLVVNWENETRECYCCDKDLLKVFYYCSACDFAINIACVDKPPTLSILSRRDRLALHSKNLSLSANTMDSDSESELISLISQVLPLHDYWHPEWESKIMPLIIQIISLVRSIDFDSQPKPASKLMSLVTQTISVFNSMDLDILPKPLWKLILLISQKGSTDSDQKPESDLNLKSLVEETLETKPDHELVSLIRQIVSLVIYMDPELKKLILLCPQAEVDSFDGKFSLKTENSQITTQDKWGCFIGTWKKFSLTGSEDATHFCCRSCNGEYHKEYEEAPLKIKHPLHRKHYLDLVWNKWITTDRICYCCGEEYIMEVLYYCRACDFTMNIACVEKAPASHVDCLKWHEHTLFLFPRKESLTCDVCAVADSSSPFYICAPCDFVVHLTCANLPRVIRICRHPHRILFTPSFGEGDWSCRICRRKIDNDYGGYSCIKEGCLYTAHSRCATQSNVWDGVDLEGVPEEIEEIVEPFVNIRDGIIQHFSHEHHHLRLDDTIDRDYDENKQCQVCITPIYFGKFYSCVLCEFVLHETCAHLSHKLYHPIHGHPLTLTLVVGIRDAMNYHKHSCFTCLGLITAGFFYMCGKEGCNFQVHAHCATISEPLIREIHMHPLYLTSKPGEMRECSVCKQYLLMTTETFNCIECDGFALCFKCAAIPEKVRYKHDKHILALSYGEETSSLTYWCEACEEEINQKNGFYICDEYCCVTLHIECLIGEDLYMKPGSSFFAQDKEVRVLSNNNHMSRPFCFKCEKRCSEKVVFQCPGSIFCSLWCLIYD